MMLYIYIYVEIFSDIGYKKPIMKQSKETKECVDFIRENTNAQTRNTYNQSIKKYEEWCDLYNKSKKDEDITDDNIAQFALYCYKVKKLAYNTIMGRVAAVSEKVGILRDMRNEKTPMQTELISQMLKSIQNVAPAVNHRHICTAEHIRKIIKVFWEIDMNRAKIQKTGGHRTRVDTTRTGMRDMLMFVFARVFLLRASEVVMLKHSDIEMNKQFERNDGKIVTSITLTLRKSKNLKKDEKHERTVIETDDIRFQRLCPVRWYKDYTEYIDLKNKTNYKNSFIFDCEDGLELHPRTPNHRLKYWLEKAGIQSKTAKNEITFHGLRIGGTTDAANSDMNIPTGLIMKYGHWSSSAGHIYMREKEKSTAVSTAITHTE